MSEEIWSQVDHYLADLFTPPDPLLDAVLASSAAAGLPEIQVPPHQGKLLQLMAQMCGAKRILELGTLGGYSTIWMARALPPDGKMVTLEYEPAHAAVAKANFERAGLSSKIDLRVGAALATLPQLEADGSGPFDLIFLDADKENYPNYLSWCLKLSHPGTIFIADNIVRNGAVIDPDSSDPRVQGVREFNALVAQESRLCATAIQMVGSKGYDGFIVARVVEG